MSPAAEPVRPRGATREGLTVVALSAALFLLVACLTVIRWTLIAPDAMRRVVDGWLLLSGDLSRIALGGTSVSPLPTLLELPLTLVEPLRDSGTSGVVLGVLFAALACAALHGILVSCGLSRRWRYPILMLFTGNPMVLFYAGNGSAEMLAVFLVVLSLGFLMDWHWTGGLKPLISLGFTVGLLSLAHRDGFLYALLVLAVLAFLATTGDKPDRDRVVGLLIAYFVPVVSAFGAWVLFSLLVPEGPARVLQALSPFPSSGAEQPVPGEGVSLPLESTSGSLGSAARTAADLFPFVAAGIVLPLVDWILTRDRLSLSLMALALTLPTIQVLESPVWGEPLLRDFMFAIPLGFVAAGYVSGRIRTSARWGHVVTACVVGGIVVALGLATVTTGVAMAHSREDRQHNDAFMRSLVGGESASGWQEEREIASYLLSRVGGRQVLVDDHEAYGIVFFTGRPELFVTARGADAQGVDPSALDRVGYVLVRGPRSAVMSSSAIGRFLGPTSGGDMPMMVREWPRGGWRLYRAGVKPFPRG